MVGDWGRKVIPLVVEPRLPRALNPISFRSPPPLSLYVHVPWCLRKCPYCDFNSHVAGRGPDGQCLVPEQAYVAALIVDLESALPLIWGRRVDSVFLGGGTPSLLSAAGVDELLAAIRSRLPLLPNAEVTLEANPGTVEAGKFAAFRAAGVNRLSLGVQSFNPAHLTALGRVHDGRQARRAIEIAVEHFDCVNLDLMYGLPEQTLAEARHDVDEALAFGPSHLSCYQLTIEPNTFFAFSPPRLPDSDTCADMQDAVEARLCDAGYVHYETSAFARPGWSCRHNLNYWLFGDYLGIGAGAHGKLTLHDRVLRQMRWKRPEQYLTQVAAGSPIQEESTVAANELPCEFMMNALRLVQGFDASLFEVRTGLPLAVIEEPLRRAEVEGLLERRRHWLVATERGRRFLNRLLAYFVLDEPRLRPPPSG